MQVWAKEYASMMRNPCTFYKLTDGASCSDLRFTTSTPATTTFTSPSLTLAHLLYIFSSLHDHYLMHRSRPQFSRPPFFPSHASHTFHSIGTLMHT